MFSGFEHADLMLKMLAAIEQLNERSNFGDDLGTIPCELKLTGIELRTLLRLLAQAMST